MAAGLMVLMNGAAAQAQEVTSVPLCFQVINQAPYGVMGSFITDFYTMNNGEKARHTSNFRLKKAGTVHEEGYPLDRAKFCSSGPFFPGRSLIMTLRTLIPIFECTTRVDRGPIIITGRRKPEGGTITTAECFR